MITTESSFHTRSDLKDDTAWGGAGKMCSEDIQFLRNRACSNTISISSSSKRISPLLNTEPEGNYFPSSWAISPQGVLPFSSIATRCSSIPSCLDSLPGSTTLQSQWMGLTPLFRPPINAVTDCVSILQTEAAVLLGFSLHLVPDVLRIVFSSTLHRSLLLHFGSFNLHCSVSATRVHPSICFLIKIDVKGHQQSETGPFWSESPWQSGHSQTTTHYVIPRPQSFSSLPPFY